MGWPARTRSSAATLWSQLLTVRSRRPGKFTDATRSPATPMVTKGLEPASMIQQRLARLDELAASGTITVEEHATRRAAIIAEL